MATGNGLKTEGKLFYNTGEAADALGIGRSTLYGLLNDGSIENVRLGKNRLVPADALEKYAAALRETPEPTPDLRPRFDQPKMTEAEVVESRLGGSFEEVLMTKYAWGPVQVDAYDPTGDITVSVSCPDCQIRRLIIDITTAEDGSAKFTWTSDHELGEIRLKGDPALSDEELKGRRLPCASLAYHQRHFMRARIYAVLYKAPTMPPIDE